VLTELNSEVTVKPTVICCQRISKVRLEKARERERELRLRRTDELHDERDRQVHALLDDPAVHDRRRDKANEKVGCGARRSVNHKLLQVRR